jgi:hypothetical protein
MINQALVREWFVLDEETGILRWRYFLSSAPPAPKQYLGVGIDQNLSSAEAFIISRNFKRRNLSHSFSSLYIAQ